MQHPGHHRPAGQRAAAAEAALQPAGARAAAEPAAGQLLQPHAGAADRPSAGTGQHPATPGRHQYTGHTDSWAYSVADRAWTGRVGKTADGTGTGRVGRTADGTGTSMVSRTARRQQYGTGQAQCWIFDHFMVLGGTNKIYSLKKY